MVKLPLAVAATIAALAGGIGWIGIASLTHRREAWDSELYWTWFAPSLAVVLVGLGFFSPVRAWRLGFIPFAGQAVVMFVQNPTGSMFPLGLILLAVYGVVFSLPARLGGAIRNWLDRRRGETGGPTTT
jgi:hypothetical protein